MDKLSDIIPYIQNPTLLLKYTTSKGKVVDAVVVRYRIQHDHLHKEGKEQLVIKWWRKYGWVGCEVRDPSRIQLPNSS